jgi:ABC-type phosphate transport system substrate-binding protein
MMLRILPLVLTFVVLLSGCYPEKKETTTRGNLYLLLTESAAPVLVEEVNQFLSLYGPDGANISYAVVSSEEAIQRFVDDTVQCIFTIRPLKAAERSLVTRTAGLDFTEIAIAHDAVVVVAHHENSVDRITTTELRSVLTGTYTRWEQLSHAGKMKGRIEVIYQDSSDVSWYLAQRILQRQTVRKDVRHANSSLQLLKAVVNQPLSIACVGLNWIDSARVPAKMLSVAETAQPADTTFQIAPEALGTFYEPHPAHIYRKFYPLRRTIYLYARAPLGSFAAGFSAFVANKDGQRIFLVRRLVPGTQPIRLKPPQ